MKLLLALTLLLFIPTETTVHTGSASSNSPLFRSFITNRDGDVHVQVEWTPKSGVDYVLTVKRLANANDPFSYTHICQVYTAQSNEPPPGDWNCNFINSPTGFWTAEFRPSLGPKVNNVTMTITAETD
jgi:hypothetical protein